LSLSLSSSEEDAESSGLRCCYHPSLGCIATSVRVDIHSVNNI
ncbi:unnamed protein product, partial [Musa hybrid cultivar]